MSRRERPTREQRQKLEERKLGLSLAGDKRKEAVEGDRKEAGREGWAGVTTDDSQGERIDRRAIVRH